MRIWDLPVSLLCRQHLLAEHRELHAIVSVLTRKRCGYLSHPETKRWVGRMWALSQRHEDQVLEMKRRGWKGHKTPLDSSRWPLYLFGYKKLARLYAVNTLKEQVENLKAKGCKCQI